MTFYIPPSHIDWNGYRMCVRAYLNGDGMGYTAHFLLFFVVMKDKCDA